MAGFRKGRGQFTAPETRTGKAFVYAGRSVRIKQGNFELTWNGPAILNEVVSSVSEALAAASTEALQFMQRVCPVDTGQLRDSCFVTVGVVNGRLQLVIGAGMPYAIYVELGSSRNAAQPYIRPTYDYLLQILPTLLKNEVKRRG